jgi:S1-C subfamily serine protease
MAAAKAQFEVADAALGSKLAEQASSLSSAQAGVNVVRVRLDTLDRNIAAGLSAIDSQLGKQSKDLGAALADVQSARARLDTIDTALAQGLASLDSKLQQDIRDLTDSVDGLRKQATALSERTTTLAEQSARLLLDTPAIHKQVKNAVVQVKVTKAAGEGTGSGFIYGADGRTVVTAHHVIRDALLIRIVTESGQSTFATVLASSQERDVAILRLPAAVSATTLQLGDSDTLEVGQPVVLVGTPLGEPGTVTTGIVSALHRTETYEGYTVRDMVQFDAATNRGNSGGPLLNARGEVVGIAVAGVVPTSGSGINFAVPSNAVAVVLADALR